jgi:hypothetical protein
MPLVHRYVLEALVDLYDAIGGSRTVQHPDLSESYDAADATRVNDAFDACADYEKHFRAALTAPDDGPPQ